MKRSERGCLIRVLVLAGVIAAPIIASAEDEGKNDTKNELGFMGGGGRGQSVGCVSANLLNFSGAVEYSRKIKEDQKVVVHGYYEGSKFDGWEDCPVGDRYENGMHNCDGGNERTGHAPDFMNQAALSAFYSWNVNRYFGFSAGLSSNLYIDTVNNRVNVQYMVPPVPVMPSLELRAGKLDLVYFAIRFQHPDMTLNYDFLGADIVVPAWKYAEFAVGVNYGEYNAPLSAQLGIKIKPVKWISIPLSMKYEFPAPIDHGFNVTAGLQFDF